ncbi:MAG: PQQ-dependent sugar dehydrogenase [Nocardioidaceae bacterium]
MPTPTTVTVAARPDHFEHAQGTTIASDLDVPWGIAFFPNGDALVSERDTARLLRVTPGGRVTKLATVPGVTPTSEGGLLGVAVSPSYARDKKVFVYATTAQDNRVLAGTLTDFRAGHEHPILTGIPRGQIHNGGRLGFGPDDMLYASTGETGNSSLAQDRDSLGGKLLRISPDGSIPSDNPFNGSPVWTYGHRNVQGFTWDRQGRMWASEFGSQIWDEINLIRPGHNYGWPAAEGTAHLEGMTNPFAVFSTDAASPSGLAFADGSLWMGALQGRTTWRLPVKAGGGLGAPVAVRLADARTRTVVTAPDGRLWVTTSDTDGRGTPRDHEDRIIAVQPAAVPGG